MVSKREKWYYNEDSCCCLVIKLFPTLVTPWTIAYKAPLSMRLPRQEHWSWLTNPSLRDLPDPGIEPAFPVLAGIFFTTEPPGKVKFTTEPLMKVKFNPNEG